MSNYRQPSNHAPVDASVHPGPPASQLPFGLPRRPVPVPERERTGFPPSATPTTDNFHSGLGIGLNHSSAGQQRAVSAAVPSGYQTRPQSHHPPAYYGQAQPSSGPSFSQAQNPAHPSQSSTNSNSNPNYHRSVSYSVPGQLSPQRIPQPPQSDHHRALPPSNVLVPGLRPAATSAIPTGPATAPTQSQASRPMFDLPSIPTSDDDFASIPYLDSKSNANTGSSSKPTAASTPNNTDTMSQQQQPAPPQYSAPPRRTTGYGDDQQQQQQHHIQGSSQYQQHGQMSPRDYSTPSGGPHIKLDQAASNPSSYHSTPAVPSVLQPGGPLARPSAVAANSAGSLPTMQGSVPHQQDYQTPAKPALNLSHSYSRSSPAAAYDGSNPAFSPYTPTTPGAAGSSSAQFMSPTDRGYDAPGSQRNISHTPLGLADIRPRADSSLSDGLPSGMDFAMQNAPPGTSNYMAPWATYAFDWCKWAPQGNGAGKVAIGSYLEDGHNFVRLTWLPR